MPISQATVISIYGDLADLVEKLETLYNLACEPDLFSSPEQREQAVRLNVMNIAVGAKEAQQNAIDAMLKDDAELHFHPFTGRMDE